MSGCGHDHGPLPTGARLLWSVLLTGLFVLAEASAGWIGHSLALLSDAGHNLADVLALLLSWYALRMASRPGTGTRTFGYHRVGIFAALINAFSLMLIAAWICVEAAGRTVHPVAVRGSLMIVVALASIVINGVIALWLRGAAHQDLNVRGAYIHMLGDALSAAAVVAAGAIVLLTGKVLADPIVSMLIGLLILYSSWGILKESVGVLLEAAPAGLDMKTVRERLGTVPGVADVHDLHVWTVGPGLIACSCHVVVADQSVSSGQQVQAAVAETLDHEFNVNHTTVQVEVDCRHAGATHCALHH
jgi:cobalt-zinc-cadmium efflux system protein